MCFKCEFYFGFFSFEFHLLEMMRREVYFLLEFFVFCDSSKFNCGICLISSKTLFVIIDRYKIFSATKLFYYNIFIRFF